MGRKTNKEKAIELLNKLTDKELQDVLKTFDLGFKDNSYSNVEELLKKQCPNCGSEHRIKKGKTRQGLTRYQCKDCGKRFTILSNTPLEKTTYDWNVWVTILEKMLNETPIKDIQAYLVRNGIVRTIDTSTVSAMCNKLRDSFIYMPLPKLNGNVQVDEKHFKENQKASHNLIDPFNPKKTRAAFERTTASLYGTMGPEFSTICCAVDEFGHSVAKVVGLGRMTLEDFELHIGPHLGDVRFLCSDMNTVYTQYASIHKIPQYVCNSNYHKVIKELDTPGKRQRAYELDKLEYVTEMGVMPYTEMINFRKKHHLTINGVNGYHKELAEYINGFAHGVSTKHLQAWVSFFNYKCNFKTDYGYKPTVYADAEVILIELLKLRVPITINDIKTEVDLTKRPSRRYTQKFITRTVAARKKSNNQYIKFTEEDGVWVFNKVKTIKALPEYKRRILAKALKIKPFSPIAVSSKDLIKQLLSHPDLENMLYVLAENKTDEEDDF